MADGPAVAGGGVPLVEPAGAYAGTPTYDPVFYYYHPDHLGSAQLMTDRAGEVVQHYGYSPYGCERYRANDDAFSVSNRYTGQTLDEDTGLYYYYDARYYDPELARFLQPDSTVPDPGFSQAYNRYAYVYNNPLKFTDPTGQFPWALAAAVMKAISAFNTIKAVCVAVHTGDFRGLAIGLTCSILGGAVGGQIGGAIGSGSQLAIALGGAIGAATFTAAFTGGNVARAIGEAVVWAYASYYCKLKADATTASAGEVSVKQKHLDEIRATSGDQQGKPPMLWARFGAKDDSVPQRTWRDWAWGKVNDAVNWTVEALPSDENLYRVGKACTTIGLAAGTAAAVLATAGAATPALTGEGLLVTGADGLGTLASSGAALGAASTSAIRGASALANARTLGAAGEAAVRAVQDIGPKVRIPYGNSYIIPDGLTTQVLSEVKNVAYQPWTQQLSNYADWASQNGRTFDLYIRSTTTLSAGVNAAQNSGAVNIVRVPGMGQ